MDAAKRLDRRRLEPNLLLHEPFVGHLEPENRPFHRARAHAISILCPPHARISTFPIAVRFSRDARLSGNLFAMQIVLVRHADAEPESSTTLADFGRALTPLGRRQARDTAVWLASSLTAPLHLFLTSPLVRTVQTAEICAGALPGATVAVAEALRSGQSTMAQLALVRGLKSSTALVGHEPNMAELAAALLERRSMPFAFAKGACLLLAASGDEIELVSYRAPFGNVITAL